MTHDELMEITEIWVKAALNLDERNLKVMERLVRAQNAKTKLSTLPTEKQKIG